MTSTQALSVVLGEKRNARIDALEEENRTLSKDIRLLEQKLQHFMGVQDVANCICDKCKTEIYLTSKSFNNTMKSLCLIGWRNTYLVTSMETVTYYGTCPACTIM